MKIRYGTAAAVLHCSGPALFQFYDSAAIAESTFMTALRLACEAREVCLSAFSTFVLCFFGMRIRLHRPQRLGGQAENALRNVFYREDFAKQVVDGPLVHRSILVDIQFRRPAFSIPVVFDLFGQPGCRKEVHDRSRNAVHEVCSQVAIAITVRIRLGLVRITKPVSRTRLEDTIKIIIGFDRFQDAAPIVMRDDIHFAIEIPIACLLNDRTICSKDPLLVQSSIAVVIVSQRVGWYP